MSSRNILLIALGLVLFVFVMRFLPHAPNATPITAVAFVASIYLGKKWGIALPLVALFLSDVLIGFYDWKIMLSVYGSFALIGLISFLNRRGSSFLPVGFSVAGSSLLFFFVTNTAVWLFSPWYAKSVTGLLYAYELGLPFLRNMFVGDVAYFVALVAVFEFARALSRSRKPGMVTAA